jgi:hypothetical protein
MDEVEDETLFPDPYAASWTRSEPNPFEIPEGFDDFYYRETEDHRRQVEFCMTRSMTLVQRTKLLEPPIPRLVSAATQRVHEPGYQRSRAAPRPEKGGSARMKDDKGRTLLMPELIAQERDIFRMNLMLGKKRREMAKMGYEMDTGQQTLLELIARVEKQSDEYKLRCAQIEANVAGARKAAEAARRSRMDLDNLLKRSMEATETMQSQIIKNEDNIQIYRIYNEFIQELAGGSAVFREHPQALIDRFTDIEQENLFLAQNYEALGLETEKKRENLDSLIQEIDRGIMQVLKITKPPPVSREADWHPSQKGRQERERIDSEIQYLGRLITKSYIRSFGVAENVSVMGMLERFELTLETLHRKLEMVQPGFAAMKQKEKDEERKKERRLAAQEQRLVEQQLKVDQALMRARRPRKEKNGRPIVKRMLPMVIRADDTEKIRAELLERKRLEQLMFEEDDD